jgi:diacylglycerol kinase (ATP)
MVFSLDELPVITPKSPILCAINPKSGSQNSLLLLKSLYACLNPCQIHDLSTGSPFDFFMNFRKQLTHCRILVCGGDGTVGWILNVLDDVEREMRRTDPAWKRPAVAVLPLGTGNDMARSLGWGAGWSGQSVSQILQQVRDAAEIPLDRWVVSIQTRPVKSGTFVSKISERFRMQPSSKRIILNNYLSIGVDASIGSLVT